MANLYNNCCFANTIDNFFVNTSDNTFFDCGYLNSTTFYFRGGDKEKRIKPSEFYYGRKPYLAKTYHEMMLKPSRKYFMDKYAIYKSARKEFEKKSQFDKPYLEDDYQEMENYYPWRFWMPMFRPPNLPGYPDSPNISPDSYVRPDFCSLTCHGDIGRCQQNCNEIYGYCYVAVGYLDKQGIWIVTGDPIARIEYYSDVFRQDFMYSGGSGGRGKSIKIFPDWSKISEVDNKKEAKFKVKYIETALDDETETGNICYSEVEVSCCEECACPADPALADPGTNPSTVTPEDETIIRINGGCLPLTWSVSGTGFSLAYTKTENRYNVLKAGASACGIATITVTDECGDSVTLYVRSTTGQWVLKSSTCQMSGTGTLIGTYGAGEGCTSRWTYELISDYRKQTQTTCASAGCNYDCCADYCPGQNNRACGEGWANCIDQDHDFPCWYDYPNPGDCTCMCAKDPKYYEWEC